MQNEKQRDRDIGKIHSTCSGKQWYVSQCFSSYMTYTRRYKNFVHDFDISGLTHRVYKFTKKTLVRKTRLYTEADVKSVVSFIEGFAAKFAVALPNRLPNFKDYY